MTDHSQIITALRSKPGVYADLASDLLEIHDATGISLDNWVSAKRFVEITCDQLGIPFSFYPNGA